MKDAVKSLLKAAVQAPSGTKSLEGDLGLVATLEESKEGPARLVRILKGERSVHWSFHLQPGEPKPRFYPGSLPFLPDLLCFVAWHDGFGLSASWSSVPGEDLGAFQSKLKGMLEGADLPPGLREVAEKVERTGKKATSEIWEEVRTLIPPSFVEAVSETAHNIFGGEVPQEFVAQADSISAFLTEEGWGLVPGQEPSGTSFTRVFNKLEKRRELTVRWFLGMGSITLKETDDSQANRPMTTEG